jgi:hypothetical protein
MMKNYILLLPFLALFLVPNTSNAQDDEKLSVKISGLVWAENIFDTRQTVTAREGDVLIFPEKKVLDANGEDINSKANFNMLNIHSRIKLSITAPKFLNAKVSGMIEGDFAGSANDKIGLFRLRHAIVKLNWKHSELLAGQYWHPMFTLDAFPQIVSWNAAIPYFPLERSAQLRYSYGATDNSKFSVTASTQLDFKSTGPNGPSTEYMRNSAMPELNATYVLGLKSNFLIGANLGYKTLKPQLSYKIGSLIYKSEESIGSYHFSLFSKIKIDKAFVRLGAIYGQNLFEFIMLGGYGVSGINSKGEVKYTNFNTGSGWLDIDSGMIGKNFNLGFFAGYTKNYGAENMITGAVYARGTDIDNSYRFSPRLIYGSGNLKFRGEVSYDVAAYGTPDANYKVQNTYNVSNTRFLLATTLHF